MFIYLENNMFRFFRYLQVHSFYFTKYIEDWINIYKMQTFLLHFLFFFIQSSDVPSQCPLVLLVKVGWAES